tara:strand:- start:485 stop:928 length:444 start_codon:yes stop_codon:yes gene_type:complete
MAHFAKLGIRGKVIAVHVVSDKNCVDSNGIEDEEVGRQFLEKIHHWPLWVQTSYNTFEGKHYELDHHTESDDQSKALRGNYAQIGMVYDEDNDLFLQPKPYSNWVLNTTTATWHSPIGDAPALAEEERETYIYEWNEDTQSWNKNSI